MGIKTEAQVVKTEKTENSSICAALVLKNTHETPRKSICLFSFYASLHSNSYSQQLLKWQRPVALKMVVLLHARLCRFFIQGCRESF